MKNDDLVKSIISGVGNLITVRVKTTETIILAELKASEARLTKRIESVEQRLDAGEQRLDLLDEVKKRLSLVEADLSGVKSRN